MPYKDPNRRKQYFKDNKDILNAARRIYRSENKEEFLLLERSLKRRHKSLKISLRRDGVSESDPLWVYNFYCSLLFDAVCHYCLGDLNPTGGGLDRIDNSTGHVCYNVVPCCRQCNRIKGNDISYENMMLLSPALREIKLKSLKAVA
jgi:hypothetical protein